MPSIGVSPAARRYNYLLGGKDHYAADRESGDALKSIFPAVEPAAWENRSFMRRVVHHLAAEYGIRQFIDVGVGLPFAPNVHEVAQTVHPDARVVYVDNDPIVAVHARALLAGTRPGVRVFVGGDVRDPEAITADPLLRGTLDLARPVAVLLFAVLHYVPDDDMVAHALHHLAAACAPGSFLAMSHVCLDSVAPRVAARLTRSAAVGNPAGEFRPRSRRTLSRLVEGLHPVAPGLVPVVEWHPTSDPPPVHPDTIVYGVVAQPTSAG
jgi:SAM-dependent methyltransferase